jgi:hypothetical protein
MKQNGLDIASRFNLRYDDGRGTRVNTCRLYIHNIGLMNRFFQVKVFSTVPLDNGKVETKVIKEFSSVSLKDVGGFLARCAIPKDELFAAVEHLNVLEHNCAHFGAMGSFMYSTYEGYVQ